MSRLGKRLLMSLPLLLLAALSANAVAAQESESAQQASAVELELVQRLDSLMPLYNEARRISETAAARRAEALKQAALTDVDTIKVGPLNIVALPEQAELARELFSEVWQEYENFAVSPSLQSHHISFQWVTQQFSPIYLEGDQARVELRRWRSSAFVKRAMRRVIGSIIESDISDLRLGEEWVNAALYPPTDLSGTYRELASMPSKVSRACLAGDAGGCLSALGLDEGPQDLESWYTPDERVELARRVAYRYGRYPNRPEIAPCTIQGDVEFCDDLLRNLNPSSSIEHLAPLGADARLAMIWLAVDAGGEGAFERLLANPEATPAEALQIASGMTSDQLARLWRTEVLEHRPAVYAGALPMSGLALLWIALFAALAMRSTRWRLG